MSTRRAAASEAQKTSATDVKDGDIEMEDRPDDAGSDIDAEGEPEVDSGHDMLQTISNLSSYLCSVEEDGDELAAGFQRIPNRRVLPDYFEVISEPVAFSTIRGKIQKKQYTSFAEFVRDVAQICHNAQVYNRPSAPIFGAAVRLREVFREKLQEMAVKGHISSDDAKIPDLGDIPPAEDSPPPESDVDEEDDLEDEDEDDDSSDEASGRQRGRGNRRGIAPRGRGRYGDQDENSHKRGRPPSVLTPTEARISSLIRSLRKAKDDQGNPLILPFEKLPDKAVVPDYYETIADPIALDHIKKKARRKKYQSVDHVLADIEKMFENAKAYNEDDSPLFNAAVELQKQARTLAEEEKARPDEDFRDEDGKLPLDEVDYNGEKWKVGDWVHIRNPNDLAKPIVAQIFRTWQDREGQKWINACWYYRPEQTVHRFDKHFFDHEVVKTGQYRDHRVEDVLDRCFVMFVTRFNRGRPRGLARDKEIYICESRYNEEKFRFNKIKTWASCLPEEVRDRDYEMDLFDAPPHRMQKKPSPIKHLLREDAKETDNLPKPTWGSPNAPPIVGATHRRPREANDSPPPEPSPLPPASVTTQASLEASRRQSMLSVAQDTPADMTVRGTSTSFPGLGLSPSPNQYQTTIAPTFPSATPGMAGTPVHQPMPLPQAPQHSPHPQAPIRPPNYQQQAYAQGGYSQSPASAMHHQAFQNPLTPSYGQAPPPPTPRSSMVPVPGNTPHNMYNPPRPPEVYTLSDTTDEVFSSVLRHQYQCDDNGRVIFFTAPPLDRSHTGLSPENAGLGHSAKFIQGRREWLAEREKKRKARDGELGTHLNKKPAHQQGRDFTTEGSITEQATSALEKWFQDFDKDTARWRAQAGLEGWERHARV
ncbi:chromatin structure-remodeling complex subunit RSC1/2 [Geosmithia morbida]|uniref:Chromatin structure-remodeling complex subunit RSC1/2 n=1 Tax=Geosmithia morbida TaxID=1094350 RepID=A0A9P4YV70_9HYPO|nr:chromatin structure-remodeling complex subunit RSC1/2 [Geosmithia morbida]KAF4121589.1 chromatin structure-remodeling complex subunit RSC1/2 [Geosmithia morbida]